MQIYKKANLKSFHTFSVDVTCDVLIVVETQEELVFAYKNAEWGALPKLLLGKGSNVLFTDHFKGVVIINRLLGIDVSNSVDSWKLHVNGGEDWPNLVAWTVEKGYFGLENLALIPGCAGSAPIQNIGAYGVEFKDVCEYVEVLDLDSFSVKRLIRTECKFGYRDSIFKNELYKKVVIVAVGLKLPKDWQPITNYGNLKALPNDELTAKRIFDEVCQVRMSKLPDPMVTGNAGSFFKNPVVSTQKFDQLKAMYPDMVAYASEGGMKLAAGWLIDQSGLKGTSIGGAKVHEVQGLVLINSGNATPKDIISLASKVRSTVLDKYQVSLEHEVRFYDSKKETYLHELVSD